MHTIKELRSRYEIADNVKCSAVLNRILRQVVPGGAEVLDALTRAHEMQHGRNPPDAALQYIIDKLRDARDKMCDQL